MNSTQSIPKQYDALIPYLVVRDAARAIDFYRQLFGATELMRLAMPNSSTVAHAEIKIRDHVLMLGEEVPPMGILSPLSLSGAPPASVMLYVNDVDEQFNKAVSLGCKPLMPPADMFWGDRFGKFSDPFGHHWAVATHFKDPTPEELASGIEAWAKSCAVPA